MKRNKLIGLIIAVLLINTAFLAIILKGHDNATKDLKQDMHFVSGSEGVAAAVLKEEVKAEEEQQGTDDFIVTAIGNKINSSKNRTTALKTASTKKKTSDKTILDKHENNNVTEKKPEESKDEEKIPFDISNPEIFESGEVEYADNQILIKFKKSFNGKVDQELKSAGIGKLEPMFQTEEGDWYVAYLHKRSDVNNTMEAVRAMDKVVVAEYNFKSEAASIDTDPLSNAVTSNELAGQQWVLKSCGIQASWDYLEQNDINPGGSSSVTVAVIDTGVDYNHKDLVKNIWTNNAEAPDNGVDDDNNGYIDDYYGIDMTAGQGSGMDDHGHGTHVAGIIAAENNDIGVVGIAYNTKVMPIKAGDASGYFMQDNIANAIMYAYNQGADVINMSFGGGASSVAVRDALEVAYSRCVLVAAAGNSTYPNEPADYYPVPMPSYPGNYKFVLGVMSSDKNDVESGFSNWDTCAFNNNEYEVYAPGNEVLSTLPGDRYAPLSGTSMASPVVAAQAALLRSMFNDPDTYPTKFIYGQISGTAEKTVSCCNPNKHTVAGSVHNTPGRINFEKSFKDLPKPELSVSDYTIFDTKGFVSDKEGIASEAASVNNGDGIIDSGEVVALGFTLRNRWGMSKDTVVSINATNDFGVTNPYVTILNNDINYGSVGTYSEQDSGRIIDNDMWTGWEQPFYLKIADNCPNDYTISINISITCKNGLDETDQTGYTAGSDVLLVVRNGVILPNKITEDMTLTADNYYIIPNSTVIMSGATVTVEPGTKIQFWTDDPNDSYADSSITYLKVLGKLYCKGTEEAPIEMFPSGLMGHFRVEIYTADNGFVSMDYTNVSNPYLTIQRASNCVFNQVYPNTTIQYRELNGGNVITYTGRGIIKIKDAEECVFYKLGGRYIYERTVIAEGNYNRCAFIDSAIEINQYDTVCTHCVFYGNNNIADGSNGGSTSTNMAQMRIIPQFSVYNIIHHTDWDKYYISLSNSPNNDGSDTQSYELFDSFAKKMDGSLFNIDSKKEFEYVAGNLCDQEQQRAGTRKGRNGEVLNYNGSAIPNSVQIIDGPEAFGVIEGNTINFTYRDTDLYLLEVPGNGLVTDIVFDKYVVNLETGNSYQIEATLKPDAAVQSDLVFTSENESVATVDTNGVITAVAPGTTQIKAYSQDMAIYNYVTVNVTDYVAIESLSVAESEIQLNIGDSKKIKPVYTPTNTTRTALTYSSSDESIATVSAKGIITAVSEGDAEITVTGENDLTATVTVHSVIPAESIAFSKDYYETILESADEDTIVTEPTILPLDATNKALVWESTNPDICMVEDGYLRKYSTGIVTLRATVQNTDISDEITVIITDNNYINPVAVKTVKYDGEYMYAITEVGEIFVWGSDIKRPTKMPYQNVEDAYVNHSSSEIYILDKNGDVSKYAWSISDAYKDESFGTLRNIKSLSSSKFVSGAYHAIDKSGNVWAWGNNASGQLGDGSRISRDTPVQIEFEDWITKTLDLYYTTIYLSSNGEVFASGGDDNNSTPIMIRTGASDIYSMGNSHYFTIDYMDQYETCHLGQFGSYSPSHKDHSDEIVMISPYMSCYIDNGDLYIRGRNGNGQLGIGSNENVNEFTLVKAISNVKDVIAFSWAGTSGQVFVIDDRGNLYGTGYNANGEIGIGTNTNVNTFTLVPFFSEDYSNIPLTMTGWNGSPENTISSDGAIILTFNIAPIAADDYSMITLKDDLGNTIGITKKIDMNKLVIKPKTDLEEVMTYNLTIPQMALKTKLNGVMSNAINLDFVGHGSAPADDPGIDPGEDPQEDIQEDSEAIHSVVTDEAKLAQRERITTESLKAAWKEFTGLNVNANFYSNVILNRTNDDDTSGWLRISAPESSNYQTISLGRNYWGTTNEKLINKQILDFDDYQSLADIKEEGYLTEAPSDTFPFVTEAYLTVNGGRVDTVGNEEVTFVVDFNRAMDTSIPLDVKFGSSYPYAEYTIEGEYVSDTEWQGTVTLTTLIENGYQYFSVSNGKAAGTSLKLYKDWGRFPFKIDTASAQSLIMQGNATEEGIELFWEQDDFDTLAGYNVYRSTSEDGYYERVNTTVIPADTKYLLDNTVEPGVKYYYNFTVVQSDMTESEPSGKVQVTSLDTMAPNIYHTPVTTAYKGSNLVVSATIIDNVGIQEAKLYYRVAGTEEWKSRVMDGNNDKYSAVINSSFITDDGLEYYIEAFDGVEYKYSGLPEEPYFVTVQQAITTGDLGDVDGNGVVELKDAMMLLQAVNDRLNLKEDEFIRADLDGDGDLSASEALKILYYINGTISSLR